MSQTYNPILLTAGVQDAFLRQLSGAESASFVPRIATEIASNKSSETYAWIGESPAMQAWSGEARFDAMSNASYAISNSKFQSGLVIDRDDLADDQVGGLELRIQQLAQVAIGHRNKLLINALINGTTNTGHDSTAFFSDTHPIRGQMSATQDNLLAGTGTTTAQIQADITSSIAAMMRFVAENGEPFHEAPQEFVIVAPPNVMGNMNEAIFAGIVSNTSNVRNAGLSITPLYTSRLTDVNDWYLLRVDTPLRPLIFQVREPVTLEPEDVMSTGPFEREQYRYKVRGRYNVGYGHWANAVKVVNS